VRWFNRDHARPRHAAVGRAQHESSGFRCQPYAILIEFDAHRPRIPLKLLRGHPAILNFRRRFSECRDQPASFDPRRAFTPDDTSTCRVRSYRRLCTFVRASGHLPASTGLIPCRSATQTPVKRQPVATRACSPFGRLASNPSLVRRQPYRLDLRQGHRHPATPTAFITGSP